jgi:large subunit ribosomal protein L17
MKHLKTGRKFGRVRKVRKALIKSLVVGFAQKGKIKTTEAKAKELRPLVEKIITRAMKGGLADRKLLISKAGEEATKKYIEEIAPKCKGRTGGYTRIIKLPSRKGDASKMAIIELVI